MEFVKITFYFLLYFFEAFLLFVFLYFLVAFILLQIPFKPNYKQSGELTEIFVKSNGVHCDLVIPISHKLDWKSWLDSENYKDLMSEYVGIGWGDKGFYVDTPEWSDLKLSTAFNALFLQTETLMHVTFQDKPETSEKCKSIWIDETQYDLLIQAVLDRFVKDDQGKPILLENAGYTENDNFYSAHGSYSLFVTCNVWTNTVLRKIKVKTVYWAPFEKWVLKYL